MKKQVAGLFRLTLAVTLMVGVIANSEICLGQQKTEAPKNKVVNNKDRISVKLPGMTWGGCAASVRSDLKKINGITDIKTDTQKTLCTFKAKSTVKVKKVLNELAKTNSKIKGWSFKKKKKKATKAKQYSISLPGMTWGGCAASVRSDLESVEGITNVKTDVGSNSATFKATVNVDAKKVLNKLAKSNSKIEGWSFKN